MDNNNTNSNMKEAVLQMLNGECYTFQGLVRRLREEKFDPAQMELKLD